MGDVSSGDSEPDISSSESEDENPGPSSRPLDTTFDSDVPLARLAECSRKRSPMPSTSRDDRKDKWTWSSTEFFPKKFGCVNRASANLEERVHSDSPAKLFWGEFFTTDIVERIVEESNRYQGQNPLRQDSQGNQRSWSDVTIHEIKAVFCLMILMGLDEKPEMKYHWSIDPLLESRIFRETMPRDRFMDILAMLHFNDNEAMAEDEVDRLYKLRPVVDHLSQRFRSLYTPSPSLTVDESLWKFRGRLKFKQYNPKKRARFGIKVFKLCESGGVGAGYTLKFRIYTGQDRDPNIPASQKVVLELVSNLNNLGYNLALDRGFSSPELFAKLYQNRFNVVGTVQANRKHMPRDLATVKLQVGQVESRSTPAMMAFVWMDKRPVRMLTTMHRDEMLATGKRDRHGNPIRKPAAVIKYNNMMGGVDKSDQHATSHNSARRSVKWYKKLFFYLLDCSLVNAFCLFKFLGGSLRKRRISFVDFRLELVRDTLEELRPHLRYSSQITRQNVEDKPARLTQRHFPEPLPDTQAGNRKPRRNCHVCYKHHIRKQTPVHCPDCRVSLCLTPCFKTYHTMNDY